MITLESTTRAADEFSPSEESPLELVHRLHGKHLFRFLLRFTLGDRREAEDLVQETMLRAWRHLQDHPGDSHRLRPWLYTVGRRLAIDAARSRNSRPSEVIPTDLSTLPTERDEIDRALVSVAMRRGLMELSSDHRRVLIEVYFHGQTTREAAERLNIPEGTAKSRMHYALRALAAATGGVGAMR